MKIYYVSLTRDLIGCYLKFKAESELAVRQYLFENYKCDEVWKLPWCSIYDVPPDDGDFFINAKCGALYEEKNTETN